MTITLTVTGDTISPEIANMLQSLGVALSNQKQSEPVNENSKIHEPEPDLAHAPAKRTRTKKEIEPKPEPEAAEEPQKEGPAIRITLEALREKVVTLAKAGKTNEIKAVFAEFDAAKLQDIKKADYEDLNEKLNSL